MDYHTILLFHVMRPMFVNVKVFCDIKIMTVIVLCWLVGTAAASFVMIITRLNHVQQDHCSPPPQMMENVNMRYKIYLRHHALVILSPNRGN